MYECVFGHKPICVCVCALCCRCSAAIAQLGGSLWTGIKRVYAGGWRYKTMRQGRQLSSEGFQSVHSTANTAGPGMGPNARKCSRVAWLEKSLVHKTQCRKYDTVSCGGGVLCAFFCVSANVHVYRWNANERTHSTVMALGTDCVHNPINPAASNLIRYSLCTAATCARMDWSRNCNQMVRTYSISATTKLRSQYACARVYVYICPYLHRTASLSVT